jgi:hypothetical protein
MVLRVLNLLAIKVELLPLQHTLVCPHKHTSKTKQCEMKLMMTQPKQEAQSRSKQCEMKLMTMQPEQEAQSRS